MRLPPRFDIVGQPRALAVLGSRSMAGYSAEAVALFTAMSTTPSAARKRAVDTFIRALKAGGVWSLIDYMNVYAAADSQAALLNWKNPGTLTAAPVNSPTFTADQGYTFDGVTNYLNTGFIPSTNASAMTGTSMMIGTYERTNVGATTRSAGTSTTATRNLALVPRSGAAALSAQLNSGTTTLASSITDSRGLTCIDTDGTTGRAYRNGAQAGTGTALTAPGTVLPSLAVYAGGYNSAGVLTTPRAAQESALLVGAMLTAAQHLALYNALQAYMTTLGSNV